MAPRLAQLGRFPELEDPLADDVTAELVPWPRGEQEQLINRLLSASPVPVRALHEALREVPFELPVQSLRRTG